MTTVLVLYNHPADLAKFDEYYEQKHIPIASKIPGLRSFKTSRGPITSPAGPSPYYLIAELTFDSMVDVEAANGTPEGQAAGADLANFAQAGVTYAIYETQPAQREGDKFMVVLLVQYNVRPEKATEYQTWLTTQVPIAMKAPGIVDLKAYNSIAGEHEVTALDYFEDLTAFATWRANEGVKKIFDDLWHYAENVRSELLISESKSA